MVNRSQSCSAWYRHLEFPRELGKVMMSATVRPCSAWCAMVHPCDSVGTDTPALVYARHGWRRLLR